MLGALSRRAEPHICRQRAAAAACWLRNLSDANSAAAANALRDFWLRREQTKANRAVKADSTSSGVITSQAAASDIQQLVDQRDHCRQTRDWKKADGILGTLRAMGIQIDDSDNSWTRTQPGEGKHLRAEKPIKRGRQAHIETGKQMMRLKDHQSLLDMYSKEGKDMDEVGMAILFVKLGRVHEAVAAESQPWHLKQLHGNPVFLELCEAAAAEISGNRYGIRACSNIVDALTKLKFRSKVIFDSIAAPDIANRLAKDGNPQELSNLVRAYVRIGRNDPALFEAVAAQSKRLAKDGNPRNLSNAVWAYATAGRNDPALFEAVAQQSKRLAKDGEPQNLSNTVWAYATAGRNDPALFDAVAQQSKRLAKDGKPQNLTNAVWAYAISGRKNPALFEAVSKTATGKFRKRELYQLQQAFLAADVQITAALASAIHQATNDLSVNESRSQRQVSDGLLTMGWSHVRELMLPMTVGNMPLGSLSVDMGCAESKVAVEFHGPSHYIVCGTLECTQRCTIKCLDAHNEMNDVGGVEGGATRFKARLMEQLGWSVVAIHYKDWAAAKTTNSSNEFLKGILTTLRGMQEIKSV